MNRIPVIDMTATGRNITRLRINAGITVKDLQDIFGFNTPQAIYKWQRGTALPTVDNLVALAAVFGVRIDDMTLTNERKPWRIFTASRLPRPYLQRSAARTQSLPLWPECSMICGPTNPAAMMTMPILVLTMPGRCWKS